MSELTTNPMGFKEVSPKPTDAELQKYYNDTYFLKPSGNQYTSEYSAEELFQKTIPYLEVTHLYPRPAGRLLDIACGEGFMMNTFSSHGWDVTGTDFTSDGIKHFFPQLASKVKLGNLFETLDGLIAAGQTYDLVLCHSVLEHVTKPDELIKRVLRLTGPKGVSRWVVPNDFSPLQMDLLKREFISEKFWVAIPDHLTYFNADNFPGYLRANGLNVETFLTEFPIDMLLYNPDTNYQRDKAKGRGCHLARTYIEAFLAREGMSKLIAFRKGCAQAGIGRNLIAYCSKA